MSIWCSWPHIGTDPTDGNWRDMEGNLLPPEGPQRGNVLSYAEGFSNHHPDLTGSHERPAVIALATIAPWCVPGHNQDGERYSCSGCGLNHDHPQVGAWLRVEVAAPETLSFWEKDADGSPKVTSEGATVVLDVAAATALRDDLTAWLRQPKVIALAGDRADDEQGSGR